MRNVSVALSSVRESKMTQLLHRGTSSDALLLSADDNIVVALDMLKPDQPVHGVTPTARIPRGHKMARLPIARDQAVVKYGQVIGFAKADIAAGDWVHEHNVYLHDFTAIMPTGLMRDRPSPPPDP